jgi:SAM-dependent methyltransferase
MYPRTPLPRPILSTAMDVNPTYSVKNGMRFAWSSLTGNLDPGRRDLLETKICGQAILDAGCGGGAFVEHLASQGRRVTGLDFHAVFLDLARARPGAMGTYIEGDVTALPFPDGSFDCTYCFDVLEHVDDVKAFAELVRVSRQRVILAVPGTDLDTIPGGVTFHHYRDHTHLRTYTKESLAALCATAGQHRCEIQPELVIDLKRIAIQQLDDAQTRNPIRALLRNGYHGLLRILLRHARYRTIYTGWTAVIDLQPRQHASPG